MKKLKIINSDHNPIKVGDNVTIDLFKSKKTSGGLKKPKINKLDLILNRLDTIDTRLGQVETTLQEHSAIFKRNNLR